MIKVFVVDDQPLMRAGLLALLHAAPGFTVVGEAGDGYQAVIGAAAVGPDVIVMDIRMPGVDGISATRSILAASAEPPRILILTTFDLDKYVYAALRAGASGFILKETQPERILTAIRTVAAGDMLFAPTITRRLIEAYLQHRDPAAKPAGSATLDSLTTREREILRLVATGLSNSDIAAHLFISPGTVKTHLNRVMTKLDIASRAQAVVVAYESGLITPAPPATPGGRDG